MITGELVLSVLLTVVGTLLLITYNDLRTKISSLVIKMEEIQKEIQIFKLQNKEDHSEVKNSISILSVKLQELEKKTGRLEERIHHIENDEF